MLGGPFWRAGVEEGVFRYPCLNQCYVLSTAVKQDHSWEGRVCTERPWRHRQKAAAQQQTEAQSEWLPDPPSSNPRRNTPRQGTGVHQCLFYFLALHLLLLECVSFLIYRWHVCCGPDYSTEEAQVTKSERFLSGRGQQTWSRDRISVLREGEFLLQCFLSSRRWGATAMERMWTHINRESTYSSCKLEDWKSEAGKTQNK